MTAEVQRSIARLICMCPARRSYVAPGLCAISKASPRVMVGWVAPSMVAADGSLSICVPLGVHTWFLVYVLSLKHLLGSWWDG